MHSRDNSPVAVFLTTNRLFELDAALRRRVDHVVEFRPATYDQIYRMFHAFFPELDGVDATGALESVWKTVQEHNAMIREMGEQIRGASTSTIQKYFVKIRQARARMTHNQKTELLRELIGCAAGARHANAAAVAAMYG